MLLKSKCNNDLVLPVITVDNARLNRDGAGLRSLVISAGCPLHCAYCLNDYCHDYPNELLTYHTIDSLYDSISKYIIYFMSIGGGVTFGGGEPLLYGNFIVEFAKKYKSLDVVVESSLNVDFPRLEELMEYVSELIVDIKDVNPYIYRNYTREGNSLVLDNLQKIAVYKDKIKVRVPAIDGYNTSSDIENSIAVLTDMGFKNFDCFEYITEISSRRQ